MTTLLSPPFSLFILPIFYVLFKLFVAVLDLSVVQFGLTLPDIVPILDSGALDWWPVPLDFLVF